MWNADTLVAVALVFALAGFVKGIIGLGLPTLSLALLTATLGLEEAMALMIFPSLVTNAWQGAVGGHLRSVIGRLWSLLLVACVVIWLGSSLLRHVDVPWLSGLLGLTVLAYALTGLLAPHPPPPGAAERWLSPLVGAANGLLTGLTGSFVVPGVLYLQSLRLPRDQFIQAMGVLFTVSTAALAIGLRERELFPVEIGAVSALAVLPALLGMWVGARLRRRLTESRFRQVFFVSLLALGAYIVARSFT